MNQTEWYVQQILREIERERRGRPWSNERWLVELRSTPQPRSAFVAWLGDRLVGLGERLREWSTGAEARPLPAHRALTD
jgi:hypothetical protein